jgi:hypothetical protein
MCVDRKHVEYFFGSNHVTLAIMLGLLYTCEIHGASTIPKRCLISKFKFLVDPSVKNANNVDDEPNFVCQI